MTAIIKSPVRVFNANAFLNSFTSTIYSTWQTATSYSIGDVVINGSYKYVATTAGTSGAISPTHTSGTASDGGVTWMFVEIRFNTAYFNNNLYLGIGKVDEWTAEPTPDTPVDDDTNRYEDLASLLAVKRLEASDVSFGLPRYDWASGMSVDEYDPDIAGFAYTNPFYVYTDEDHIYKCLSNNGGAVSTSKPTGTNVDTFITADGFVWKYMATVSGSDAIQFRTTNYIPVELKLSDDGSNQWNVQQNAKAGSISTINVTAGGSGYTTAPVTIDPPPSGTTATATAIMVGGVVTAVQITIVGTGYTTPPTVTIGGDGTGATAEAVLAPKAGHGANILIELNARYLIVNKQFDDTEGGYFPVTGEKDFRQISVIADPLDVNGDPCTAPRYIGPDHDDWDGSETSGKVELMAGSGYMLFLENISPVIRNTGQIEDVKVILKF